MSKNTKIWIIIAIFLILLGNIMFCGVMNKLKWDFTKLSTAVFETNEYEINEKFKDLNIITNTANIEFVPSSNSKGLVVCQEQRNVNHSINVENNTLIVEVKDTRRWYEHIGIFFKKPKITIYLPENEYGELMINTTTGNINIPENFKFKSMDILVNTGNIKNYASVYNDIILKTSTGSIVVENTIANMIELSTKTGKVDVVNVNGKSDIKINVSTGKTNITDTRCKNMISSGKTGSIFLENVIASERFSIRRSTGDVNFKDCDANDIFVNTSTGSVKGNLLTDKTFFVQSDTGSIDAPKTMSDKKCEINTSTGNIKIIID